MITTVRKVKVGFSITGQNAKSRLRDMCAEFFSSTKIRKCNAKSMHFNPGVVRGEDSYMYAEFEDESLTISSTQANNAHGFMCDLVSKHKGKLK